MYSFKNDYSEIAHPKILKALMEANLEQLEGYSNDHYTAKAVELLKQIIMRHDIDIHFLLGGTQTNLTAISSFLRPHEAVISADTGHILVHETGSIEANGHKIISVKVKDGKLKPEHIKKVLEEHSDEHMVKPKLVYISNSTELGTIYIKDEIKQLSLFCKDNNLFLYVDGARLGSAICSYENDISLVDLGELVDAFYIGGTKNGALIGEALIICRDSLKEDFRFYMKQKGALIAKGGVLGIQFLELFKDGLYFELAKHANLLANQLKSELEELGFSLLTDSSTNQIFPILPNILIEKLEKEYSFLIWKKIDNYNSSIRLVTSWETNEDSILKFIEYIKRNL